MDNRSGKSIEIFLSYAPKDENLMRELELHLSRMKNEGLIATWHRNKVGAGEYWEHEAVTYLNKANIILLLVSPDFVGNEYCYDTQMKRALERHEKKEALVIPILLRLVDLEDSPIQKLKSLPDSNKKFVAQWKRKDDAFTNITRGIRKAVKALSKSLPIVSISKNQKSSLIVRKTLYCTNCKAPVSLPMFCWKCGLLPMQICATCLQLNPVDQETCERCKALLALVCNNCKTKNSFEADFCGNCGLQLQVICDECGTKNFPGQEVCQKCTISLIRLCSHCNQKNDLEAEICLKCGMPLIQVCITCYSLNEIEDTVCWSCEEPLEIGYYLEIPYHLASTFSILIE